MTQEANKAIVRRYFEEALDKGNLDLLDEIVAAGCVMHRPESSDAICGRDAFRSALERILKTYSGFSTTIHDLFADGDRVACRLGRQAVNRGEWVSRLGRVA